MSSLKTEIGRRRTFAIISHPDAGKTTLTEKLLWYGGAIQVAGEVRARKASRHATSDWMELEKQRGISVTSSVMQFPYRQHIINLLDTPGHEDFSEDTYRTLTAVDSAVMVIDSVNGVEAQTIKLLHVCRLRDTPIITFINKLDREGKPPIDLLDEIESVLDMPCAPMTWPIGMGKAFRGVYHLYDDRLLAFDPQADRSTGEIIEGLGHPGLDRAHRKPGRRIAPGSGTGARRIACIRPRGLSRRQADSGILRFRGQQLRRADAAGRNRRSLAPPKPRATDTREVEPEEHKFSGFVFKIQANMDPRHRDRIAFVRVCSGRFDRGMKIKQVSTGKTFAVNNAITFMAQDRNTAEEAYAGDIIGIPNHGTIRLGETFSEGETLKFTGIPSFAPELFRKARIRNPLKMKQLQKGLQQLAEEGATQLFRPLANNDLILGAVGTLQFDVVAHRLENEYDVDVAFEPCEYSTARWLRGSDTDLKQLTDKYGYNVALDGANEYVYLAPTRVNLQLTEERFPDVRFLETREIY